jgi:excisionase family DNA binding protein
MKLLNTDEAAASLSISRRTLQELVSAREVGCVKIGRAVRFHPDDLAAFVDKNRVKAVGWKGGAK